MNLGRPKQQHQVSAPLKPVAYVAKLIELQNDHLVAQHPYTWQECPDCAEVRDALEATEWPTS